MTINDGQNTDNTTNDTKNTLPEYVDLEKWRSQGYAWHGDFNLAHFPRLAELIHHIADSKPLLSFNISYQKGNLWFAFNIDTAVALNCQRCLSEMTFSFDENIKLALLDDESQANLLQDDDWVLVDEVTERIGSELRLPICKLIEDELLLQIPASLKHDIGDANCVPVEILEEESEIAVQDNPFAALADLKQQLNK